MVIKIRVAVKLFFVWIFERFPGLISDYNHSRLLYLIMFGRFPNLKNPKTFNEHICSLKIQDSRLAYSQYTDKYEVKKYVASVIGEEYLNEVYGLYKCFEEIDLEKLPEQFVFKCTHGSSYNILVRDKSRFDEQLARKKLTKWLKENFYLKDREKNYKDIQPRIICERFLESKQSYLEEFKLFCFYGIVRFIQQNTEIDGQRHSNLYSRQWKALEVQYGYLPSPQAIVPDNALELVEIAEKLSATFVFVRVDLYSIDNNIIFSELTFHSGGGLVPFKPKKYDFVFGSYFNK